MSTYALRVLTCAFTVSSIGCTSQVRNTDFVSDNQIEGRESLPSEHSESSSELVSSSALDYHLEDGWNRLPDPPLKGRVNAVVTTAQAKLIVVGGRDLLCPPASDCGFGESEMFLDGAFYDIEREEWAEISDAPFAFEGGAAAVVDDEIYLFGRCSVVDNCPENQLLHYNITTDTWDTIQTPFETIGFSLISVPGHLVAYQRSTSGTGVVSDYLYDIGSDEWTPITADPLGETTDRTGFSDESGWILFGKGADGSSDDATLVATYDIRLQRWAKRASTNQVGYQIWQSDNDYYLSPHFSDAEGGVYSLLDNEWGPFPAVPETELAGLVSERKASYVSTYGWIRDTRADEWVYVEPRQNSKGAFGESVSSGPLNSLVVFGGQRWVANEGELLNETWLWLPPTL